MNVEQADLHQKAVLWRAHGSDDYGQLKIDLPVEIDVRWEKGTRENLDSTTSSSSVTGRVFVAVEIPLKSILWLGKLVDLPSPKRDLVQVVDYSEIPDVKNRHARREVSVIAYNETLPSYA